MTILNQIYFEANCSMQPQWPYHRQVADLRAI